MEDERPRPAVPAIPVLVFAAIDLLLAVFLFLDGGLSLQFWLIAAIGLALAGVGLGAVWRRPHDE